MKVIPCGTNITTKLNSIPGIITGISIRFTMVSYEVSYFSGQDYKQIWLTEPEFNFSIKKETIGFSKQ